MNTVPWANTPVPDQATLDKMFGRTRAQLLLHSKGAGFLGSLLCDHAYVWDEEAPFSTAWCNGETIAHSPQFFAWMNPESRKTVLAHELLHTAFDHMSRRDERCPDYWNIAADHVINNLLKSWGFDFTQLMQIEPCMDPQYAGLTTEDVYDRLGPPPGGGSGSGKGVPGAGGPLSGDVRPSPNPAAAADVKGKQVKAIQAAQMAKETGLLPGEIVLQIEKFLNPILPWDQLLSRFYTDLSQDDYSWKRPSRRYESDYLPSLAGDNKLEHLTYYMDVSGSVSDDDVIRFFSEVKHIHAEHQPAKITIVTFDAKIQDTLVLNDGDPFEKIAINGRGGTDLDPVFQHIRKTKPTAAIIFSDLICHPMARDPGIPLIWIVVNNKAARVMFGKKVLINV